MRWRAFALAAVVAMSAGVQIAQADEPVPLEPRAGTPLRDRDFGVESRGFGLDRRVEMLQWQRVDGRYRLVWHDALIDAGTHDAAHANPSRMPVDSRRWWSDSARIDRKPMDRAVLQALGTWKPVRPDFAKLPGAKAARFQPEGDGLGSAANPLEPVVGDVRVTWRELALPPLEGRIELRRGTWQLRDVAPEVVAPSPLDPVDPPPRAAPEVAVGDDPPPPWPWIGGSLAFAIVVVLLGAVRLRRLRRERA